MKKLIVFLIVALFFLSLAYADVYRRDGDVIFDNNNFNFTISPENVSYFAVGERLEQSFEACNNWVAGGYLFAGYSFNASLKGGSAYKWDYVNSTYYYYDVVNVTINYTCDDDLKYNYSGHSDPTNYAVCRNLTTNEVIWQTHFNWTDYHLGKIVFIYTDKYVVESVEIPYYTKIDISDVFSKSNVDGRKVYHNNNGKFIEPGECVKWSLEYVPGELNGKWDAILFGNVVNDWTCILNHSCIKELSIDPGWESTNIFNETFDNRAFINNGTTNCTIEGGVAHLVQDSYVIDAFGDASINASLITYREVEPAGFTGSQTEAGGVYTLRMSVGTDNNGVNWYAPTSDAWFNSSVNGVGQITDFVTYLDADDPGTPYGYGSGVHPRYYLHLTNGSSSRVQLWQRVATTGLNWEGIHEWHNFTLFYNDSDDTMILEDNGVNSSPINMSTLSGDYYLEFNVTMYDTANDNFASTYDWILYEINTSSDSSTATCIVESTNISPTISLASFTTEFNIEGAGCTFSYSPDNVTYYSMVDGSTYYFETLQTDFFWNMTANSACGDVDYVILNFNSTYPRPTFTQSGISYYNDSVAQNNSINISLSVSHSHNYTINYTINTDFNSSLINVTFSQDWVNVVNTTASEFNVTIEVSNLTSLTIYSGNITLNSTLDNNVTYFVLNINVTSGSPILSVVPAVWTAATMTTGTISQIFNVTNTGYNGTYCSVSASGGLTPSYSTFNVSNGETKSVAVQFSGLSAGTYNEYLDFECNGAHTTSDPNLVFSVSAAPSVPAGGGVTLIDFTNVTLDAGKECNISVSPSSLTFRGNEVRKVIVFDGGSRSFKPSFSIEGNIKNYLSITNTVEVLPGDSAEFGIKYSSDSFVEGNATVSLVDSQCGVISVNVSASSYPESISIIERLFEFSFFDLLKEPVFSVGQKSLRDATPYFTIGVVLILCVLFMSLVLYKQIKKGVVDKSFGRVVVWLIFMLIVSFILMIFVVTILRLI